LKDLILDVVSRSAEELIKHTAGPGTRYVFSDHNNNPQGTLYAILRVVSDLDERPPEHVEPHNHEYESLFIFKGNNPDLTGLRVEVLLDKEWFTIDSPKAVRIPAGLNHTYRFVKGSGEYWNIVITPGAEYNLTVR
jgi:2-isopropylmalate synthase